MVPPDRQVILVVAGRGPQGRVREPLLTSDLAITRDGSVPWQASENSRVLGTVFGMATRKVTLSLDQTAYALAESAAARAGMSTSAWLSAAARREAVRLGAGSDWGDHHAQALADDADLAAAEAELRAAG